MSSKETIKAVYQFKQLDDESKKLNKIKIGAKIPRFDITNQNANGYGFLHPLINSKNQVNISLVPPHTIVKAQSNRICDLLLKSNRVGNLTSMWYTTPEVHNRYWGYVNPNPQLSGGNENPMFPYANDLMLIELSDDKQVITIAVMEGSKHYSSIIYPKFVKGAYDDEIQDKLEFGDNPFSYVLR